MRSRSARQSSLSLGNLLLSILAPWRSRRLLTSSLIYCGCMSLLVYSIGRLLDGFELWLVGILQ